MMRPFAAVLCAIVVLMAGSAPAQVACGYNANFTNSANGWFSESIQAFSSPSFRVTSDGLEMSPAFSAQCFGYWRSPALNVTPGQFLTISWTVVGNAQQSRVPAFRMRVNEVGFRHFSEIGIASVGNGEESPVSGGRVYESTYLVPNSANQVILFFDLLSFDGTDDLGSKVALRSVSVTCSSVATPTPVPTPTASGGPVYNAETGSWYEVVTTNASWISALDLAISRRHQNLPGHLATLASSEEKNWVMQNVNFHGATHVWLGGVRTPLSNGAAFTGWRWVTGERFEYAPWSSGDPNGGTENYLGLWTGDGGVFFDIQNSNSAVNGFLVEYESSSVTWQVYTNGANGHQYAFIPSLSTYFEAKGDAARLYHNGRWGHLASITSAGEQNFITSLPKNNTTNVWIGGEQLSNQQNPASGWNWVTGEGFGYTNWNSGEPNDSGSDERYAVMVTSTGAWFDAQESGSGSVNGYVVEFE